MSALHNNARRHRQLFKKRVPNDLNLDANEFIEKRSLPIVNPGSVPAAANAPVPSVPGPVSPSTAPSLPAGGNGNNNNPPGGNRIPPTTSNTPVRPTPPTQTQQTTPQVPVSPTTSSLPAAATSSSVTLQSSTTLSSQSSITTLPANTATTLLATQPNQLSTLDSDGTTFSVPPITTGGFAQTASAPSVSATFPSSGSSNDLSTGSIVGIVAAGLVAIAAVVVVGLWLTKRYFKNRDEGEFNRDSFVRQSVHLPDEEDGYRNPRPPTMIERHRGAYGASQTGYGNEGMYAPPVPPMPTIQPGEMMMANQANMANPFSASPVDQYGMPIQQQPALVRVSSNGSAHSYNGGNDAPVHDPHGQYQQYPVQNIGMAEHTLHSQGQGQGYAELERSSVTPYQAAQYAEISRQLNVGSVANSPITPLFGQSQGYPVDSSRLPTPAPPRVMSPQAAGPQRVMSPPQRYMSPNSVPVGGYSFPMPLSTSPPAQAPGSVARSAAMAALGMNLSAPTKPASPAQAPPTHLQPQGYEQGEMRPVSAYEEEDAYGGM